MSAASSFSLRPEFADKIRWTARGSCGNAGCTDPECRCSLCGEPIGVPEDDPRWDSHPEYCSECDLCRDEIPLMLFSTGTPCLQAQFHTACFLQVTVLRQERRLLSLDG